jgi:hypothetical protein
MLAESPRPFLAGTDSLWARFRLRRGRTLLAVQQPCALGHEAVLARDPFLDFLWSLVTRLERLVCGLTALGAFLGCAAVALNYNRARAKVQSRIHPANAPVAHAHIA